MYIIEIYNYDFSELKTKLFLGTNFSNLNYFDEVNKAGGASFSVRTTDPKVIPANFRMYNKIRIYKQGTPKFVGYIENLDVQLNTISVSCVGMLGMFNKRLFSGSFKAISNSKVETSIFNILTSLNNNQDTGISAGTADFTKNVEDIQFSRTPVLSAWGKLLNLANAEMWIDPSTLKLQLRSRLGIDKSGSILLEYDSNSINKANLLNFQVEVEGKDMVNKIIGVRQGGSTATEEDVASQGDYGLLEGTVNLNDTNSANDLTSELESIITNSKNEFYSPKIVINSQKFTQEVDLGDTVKLRIRNGFIDLERNDRVIKKEISVGDEGQENISLDLLPETSNLLPSTFLRDVSELAKRIAKLESDI